MSASRGARYCVPPGWTSRHAIACPTRGYIAPSPERPRGGLPDLAEKFQGRGRRGPRLDGHDGVGLGERRFLAGDEAVLARGEALESERAVGVGGGAGLLLATGLGVPLLLGHHHDQA